jgi:hypothetical protein
VDEALIWNVDPPLVLASVVCGRGPPNDEMTLTKSANVRMARPSQLVSVLDGQGTMRGWRRGLTVRIGIALVAAVVAGYSASAPIPRWGFAFARALNWPIILVWNRFHPSWDTYPPFYPIDTWPRLLAFLGLALPIFTLLAYVPRAVLWAVRVTRAAAHSPSAFAIYFLAGGVLGGMLGVVLWGASSYIYMRGTLQAFILVVAVAVGWGLGVGRAHVALWHRN